MTAYYSRPRDAITARIGGDVDDVVIIEERDVGNRAYPARVWDSRNGLLGVYALSPSPEPDCTARWLPMLKWSFDRSR